LRWFCTGALDDLKTGELVWEDAAAGGGVTDPAASAAREASVDTTVEAATSQVGATARVARGRGLADRGGPVIAKDIASWRKAVGDTLVRTNPRFQFGVVTSEGNFFIWCIARRVIPLKIGDELFDVLQLEAQAKSSSRSVHLVKHSSSSCHVGGSKGVGVSDIQRRMEVVMIILSLDSTQMEEGCWFEEVGILLESRSKLNRGKVNSKCNNIIPDVE
jgi:hypothetical protein